MLNNQQIIKTYPILCRQKIGESCQIRDKMVREMSVQDNKTILVINKLYYMIDSNNVNFIKKIVILIKILSKIWTSLTR